jgi:hypothetical protein
LLNLDEDDDDEDDLDAPAFVQRTRENSSTSFTARERSISDQSRRRQENSTVVDESLDEHEGVYFFILIKHLV